MINLLKRLTAVDSLTTGLMIFTFLYPIVLAVTRKLYKDKKAARMILGIIPIIIGAVLYPIITVKGNPEWFMKRYLIYYVLLAIYGIWSFIPIRSGNKKKKLSLYRILNALIIISFVPLWIFAVYAVIGISGGPHIGNYSRQGWADSFESMTYDMEKHYVLRDWKEIDFDKLRNTYIPMIKKAEQNNDKIAYAGILRDYIYEFHDEHIWIIENGDNALREAEQQAAGNDYGLTMYRINTGEIIAVLCDEDSDAYLSGIHDGTVITSWNGTPIDTAAENVKCIHAIRGYAFETKANEDIMKPVYLAGQGGDTVMVGFIDDDGKEKTAVLEKNGSYMGRINTSLFCLYSMARIDCPNFKGKMLTDDIAYLRVSGEQYDELHDVIAYLTGKYPIMDNMLNEEFSRLESEGMKKLVIDTRNNRGGYGEISMSVASRFNDIPLKVRYGIYSGGKYKTVHTIEVKENGKWSDMPIVVLTNDNCVSAGDWLVDLLGRSSNSTVMGITSSSCSGQETGGVSLLSDDAFEIHYPVLAAIDENGELLADVKSDRETRVKFDIRIPVDKDAALTIFSDSETDYELEYAIDYLS